MNPKYMNISQVILTRQLDDLCTNRHNPDRLMERLTFSRTMKRTIFINMNLSHPSVIFTTQKTRKWCITNLPPKKAPQTSPVKSKNADPAAARAAPAATERRSTADALGRATAPTPTPTYNTQNNQKEKKKKRVPCVRRAHKKTLSPYTTHQAC